MTTKPGRRRGERGASLIEFAMIAPLLFILLFGVIEFARLVGSYTSVWTAAREGARYATTSGVDTVDPSILRYKSCDGILAAAQAKIVMTEVTAANIEISWVAEDGTVLADCDSSTAPIDPATDHNLILPTGTQIQVRVTDAFDGVVPIVGGMLDGIDLSSTQKRSIYLGVLGD